MRLGVESLIQGETWWWRNAQLRAIRQTLTTIFPLVLVGSLAQLIDQTWLHTTGYYAQTLHVANWLLRRVRLQETTLLLANGCFGLAVVGAAFFVSYYRVATTTSTSRDRLTAGIIAVFGLEGLNVNPLTLSGGKTVQWLAMGLGLRGLSVSLLLGLIVGNAYWWGLRRWDHSDEPQLRTLTLGSIGLIGLSAAGFGWSLGKPFGFHAQFNAFVRGPLQATSLLVSVWGFSLLNGAFAWLGTLSPLPTSGGQTVIAAQNLDAVMNQAGWHVPTPLTNQTLLQTYGNMGGTGMMLGLLLALFLTKSSVGHRVGWLCLVPTLGNAGAPLMVGLPVILSPLLAIPFLVTPLICCAVSALAIGLHWVPATAYPLAAGTPGPLIGYLGTGGAWSTLVLAGLCLALSTAVYYPFVKWSLRAQARVEGDDNDDQKDPLL